MNLSTAKFKLLAPLQPAVAIAILTILDMFYRSGSITRRMATASSDDNPIVFHLVRSDPSSFKNDFYARVIADTQQNSIVSKASQWILENDIMNSRQIWLTIVSTQRILLYIAVYLFIKKFINSTPQTILVLTIFSSTSVYYWNLGWFGALDDQPYPMWMALPFVIFGLAYYKDSSQKKLLFSIIATVLIHPSLGLVFAGWTLFNKVINRDSTHVKKLIACFSIVGVYALMSKFLMPTQSPMPDSIKTIGLTNPHLNFFNVFETSFKFSSIRIWTLIIVFCLLAIKYENRYSKFGNNSVIRSMALYSILLVVIQQIGLLTEELLLISLVPVRFTSVLITAAYLIVVSHVVKNLFSWQLLGRLAGLIFILFPSPLIVLSFGLREIFKTSKLPKPSIAFEILIITNIVFLVLPTFLGYLGIDSADTLYNGPFYLSYLNPLNTGFMNFIVPSLFSNKQIQFLIVITFVIVALFPWITKVRKFVRYDGYSKFSSNFNLNMVHLFVALVFVLASKTGMQYQMQWSFNGVEVSRVDSYAATQVWARDSTAPGSVFFIDGAMPPYYTWRTLSERPVSNPNPIWSFYNYPKYADKHNSERNLFWENQLKSGTLDFAGQWNESYFCLSKELMNISYVVQNTEQKALKFPIAFTNEHFIVYKVSCK